jgi:hypothetical protein
MAAVQPTSTHDLQAAHADNQARREAREKDRKASEDQISKDREAMVKSNLDKMQRDSELKPTPTIEEVQQAMVGHNKDIKDSDGAPLQNPNHPVANAAQQIEVGREIPTAQPVPGNMTPEQQADYDRKLSSEHSKPAPTTAKK